MPHIHTEDNEHDLTVTAYIVRTDMDEPKALLHMHRKLHMLLPVGGHVELNETPWQAIAHELSQESGYAIDQLKILQPTSRITFLDDVDQHPYPISMNTHDITPTHFHTDIEYGFLATEGPAGDVDEGESTDIRWVTQAELEAIDSTIIYENTRQVYNFMFSEALPKWEAVDPASFQI